MTRLLPALAAAAALALAAAAFATPAQNDPRAPHPAQANRGQPAYALTGQTDQPTRVVVVEQRIVGPRHQVRIVRRIVTE